MFNLLIINTYGYFSAIQGQAGNWFPETETVRIDAADYLQPRCPSCRPTSSVKTLKEEDYRK